MLGLQGAAWSQRGSSGRRMTRSRSRSKRRRRAAGGFRGRLLCRSSLGFHAEQRDWWETEADAGDAGRHGVETRNSGFGKTLFLNVAVSSVQRCKCGEQTDLGVRKALAERGVRGSKRKVDRPLGAWNTKSLGAKEDAALVGWLSGAASAGAWSSTLSTSMEHGVGLEGQGCSTGS